MWLGFRAQMMLVRTHFLPVQKFGRPLKENDDSDDCVGFPCALARVTTAATAD